MTGAAWSLQPCPRAHRRRHIGAVSAFELSSLPRKENRGTPGSSGLSLALVPLFLKALPYLIGVREPNRIQR